jgi:2-methylcitrate dehydratase PrpD
VLTTAEMSGATLHQALAAFVVGYEIGARIAAASSMRNEIFTSGTWGVVGAAAAVGYLKKMSAERLADTIELAANLTLASSRDAVTAGASVRSLYSAMPSYLGSLIADLAEGGFRGAPNAVETVFGKVSSLNFDAERCVAGLGESWMISHDYSKPYPGCRTFHATIDAIVELYPKLARPFDVKRDTIKVGVDRVAYRDNQAVQFETMLAAKESAPVCVALAVRYGRLTPGMFVDGLYKTDDILALARKVVIEEAPRVSDMDRPGWAEIALDGKSLLKHAERIPFGNTGNPMPLSELRRKFEENASETLGTSAGAVADDMIEDGADRSFRSCFSRWLGRRDVQGEKLL